MFGVVMMKMELHTAKLFLWSLLTTWYTSGVGTYYRVCFKLRNNGGTCMCLL